MNKRSYQVLDPRIIGRPVHLMGKLTEQIREDLAEVLRARLNRRYRAQFMVGPVSLAPATQETSPPRRQLTYDTQAGRMAFCLDREILLCILGYRYGSHECSAPTDEPETASEERLAATLGVQLLGVLVERILASDAQGEPTPHAGEPATRDPEGRLCAPTLAGSGAALRDAWVLQAQITEAGRQICGELRIWLHQSCVARLLQGLAPPSVRVAPRRSRDAEPLPGRLQLTLTARLIEKRTSLGELLDARVGDVIPVSFGAADVLIGESRLFTADVAEHKGKLCLTSFEHVE
ncbi:MAG: FliM/FliN family flagellar motor C-terminal domain-containing protein [Steroidobacteraceae bacterium]|jgi:flagellar motor switch protein FliM|nr:FliM/FliN family flagellar motor C-terminal domain-containing protein [Steroidobacteraceae bacterium]